MNSDTEDKPTFTLTRLVRPKARQRPLNGQASDSVSFASLKKDTSSNALTDKPVKKSSKKRAPVPSFRNNEELNKLLDSSSENDSPKKNEKAGRRQKDRERPRRRKSSPIPLPNFSTSFPDSDSSSDDEILHARPVFSKSINRNPASSDQASKSSNDDENNISKENLNNTINSADSLSSSSSKPLLAEPLLDDMVSNEGQGQGKVEAGVPQQETISLVEKGDRIPKTHDFKPPVTTTGGSVDNQTTRQATEDKNSQKSFDKERQPEKKASSNPPRKRLVVIEEQELRSVLHPFLEDIDPETKSLKDIKDMLSVKYKGDLSKRTKSRVKRIVLEFGERNFSNTPSTASERPNIASGPCANFDIAIQPGPEIPLATSKGEGSSATDSSADYLATATVPGTKEKAQMEKLQNICPNLGVNNQIVALENANDSSSMLTEQSGAEPFSKEGSLKQKIQTVKAPVARKARTRTNKEQLAPNPIDATSRKRRKVCTFCDCCPCCSSNEGDDTDSPQLSISQSDAMIERALIRQLLKLEKTAERFAGQENAIRRKLKAHRRDMWKKRERMMCPEIRSWFLPDSKELEQELNQAERSKRLPAKAAQKATSRVFHERKSYQPTLTQLAGGTVKESSIQDNQDKIVEDVGLLDIEEALPNDECEEGGEGEVETGAVETETGFESDEEINTGVGVYRLEHGGESDVMGTQEVFRGGFWSALMKNEIGATFDDLFVDATELEDDDMRDLANLMCEGDQKENLHTDKVSFDMLEGDMRLKAEGVVQGILNDHDDLEAVETVFGRNSWKENMCYVFNLGEDDQVEEGISELESSRKRIEAARAQLNKVLDRHIRGLRVAERAAKVRLRHCSQNKSEDIPVQDKDEKSPDDQTMQRKKVTHSYADDAGSFQAEDDPGFKIDGEITADGFFLSQVGIDLSPGQAGTIGKNVCDGIEDSSFLYESTPEKKRAAPDSLSIFSEPKSPKSKTYDLVATRKVGISGARASIESEVATVVPTQYHLDYAGKAQNASPCRLNTKPQEPVSPMISLPT